MSNLPIMVIAGEHSGDILGGDLLKEIKRDKSFEYIGIGGPNMISEGLHTIANMEEISVIGFSGILFSYFKLKKIANSLVDHALKKNIKYCILIDYPGFNLELASMLKKSIPDIKIIFYVSPQIWAWRFKRIFKIQKYVDLILLLFPFEKKIYDKYGIQNVVVGHNLVQKLELDLKHFPGIMKSESEFVITLMPGSRTGEIRNLLNVVLDSAKLLSEKLKKKVRFLLPNINEKESDFIKTNVDSYVEKYQLNIEYHFQNSTQCISASDMVILASGTATLEVAYFKKPMVIIYKTSALTHFIGKKLLLIPYVGLVNILAEKFICREFLQSDCSTENIVSESIKILTDESYSLTMKEELGKISNGLGNGDSSIRAKNAILKLISS